MSDEVSSSENQAPTRMFSPEVATAERAVAAIMTGVKNYAVFPPEHASTVNMIQGILRAVNQFAEKFGSLGFEVERESLLFQDKPVYEGPSSDDNPAFVLHRAGISRFEIQPGIEEAELISFFQVYNHYRVIADEPDDDLVSALWRTSLPHIFYEASYELWSEAETALDLESLAAVDPRGGTGVTASPARGWEAKRLADDSDECRELSLASAPEGQVLWSLDPAEEEQLTELVREELSAGSAEGAVRLLLFLLGRENEPQGHEAVLGFLQESYLNYLLQHNFRRAYFILDHIRQNFQAAREHKPWALPAYKNFYLAIIRPEILARVVGIGSAYGDLDPMESKSLVALLQQLPARVGLELARLLPQVEGEAAVKAFGSIVLHFAKRSPEILQAALNSTVEYLVLGGVEIVRDSKDRALAEQHLQNFRYDSRTRIRQEASRVLTSYGIY